MPKQSRQKCVHCDKPSVPGLVKGQGLCQYHYNSFMFGKDWADKVRDEKTPEKEATMNKEALRLRPLGPNRNEVEIGDWLVLFSYQTPVCAIHQSTGEAIRTDKRWSNTTSRHVKQWLGGVDAKVVPQETLEKLINSGKLEEEKPMPGPSEKPVMGTKRVGQRGVDDWEEDRGYSVAFSFRIDPDSSLISEFEKEDSKLDFTAKEEVEALFDVGPMEIYDIEGSSEEGYRWTGAFTHWISAEQLQKISSLVQSMDMGGNNLELPCGVEMFGFVAVHGHFGRPSEMVEFDKWDDAFGITANKRSAASLPDLFNSKYVKWMQQEAALLAANLGAYTSEADAGALLDQAVQKLVATVQTAVQEEVEKVVNEARENIIEAMMEDLEAKNRGIAPAAPVAGPPEIPAEFEEQPVPMAKARRTRAQKREETEVARGMAEKGYKYIMIDTSGEIDPLYAKTPQMAAELMREDYPDKKFDVQPIDTFLGGGKTHLDSAVEKIGQMKVGPDLEAVRSNELGVCVGCGVAGVISDWPANDPGNMGNVSEDAVLLCANEYGELVCEDCAERAKKY